MSALFTSVKTHMTFYFPNLTVFFKCFNGTYYRLIIQLSRIFSWDVKVVHKYLLNISTYWESFYYNYLFVSPVVFSEKLSFTVCQKKKFVSRFFYIKIIADVLFNFSRKFYMNIYLFFYRQNDLFQSFLPFIYLRV